MDDVLQYLAVSGAEEEAEKVFDAKLHASTSQDQQIQSIRESLAQQKKTRQDEFLQKLVQQANTVRELRIHSAPKIHNIWQINVDVLDQERQLAELEALERHIRVSLLTLHNKKCIDSHVVKEEQFAYEREKDQIAKKLQQMDRKQTQDLIESSKEELISLQRQKQELEEQASVKERSLDEMRQKLQQEVDFHASF